MKKVCHIPFFRHAWMLMVLMASNVHAQMRTRVLIDMETRTPIRNVYVAANGKQAAKTDMYGRYTLAEDFDSVTFHHASYIPITRTKEELQDTIRLLRSYNMLADVVIYGKTPKADFGGTLVLPKASGNRTRKTFGAFDLSRMLDFKGNKARKRLEKFNKMMKNY
ncbi:MAG: hypothetical protein PUH24_05070 [Prevotellaceae bacterium]|nr:hypothetical protein [Prevotellaceae bacterium]